MTYLHHLVEPIYPNHPNRHSKLLFLDNMNSIHGIVYAKDNLLFTFIFVFYNGKTFNLSNHIS